MNKEVISYTKGILISSIIFFLVLKFVFSSTWFTSIGIPVATCIMLSITSIYRFKEK